MCDLLAAAAPAARVVFLLHMIGTGLACLGSGCVTCAPFVLYCTVSYIIVGV